MLSNNKFMLQLCVCRDIEHLGSLESTQEARVALGCASCNSYASFVLSKLPACSISRHLQQESSKGDFYLSWPFFLNIVVTVQQQSGVVFHQSHMLPPHTHTHTQKPSHCVNIRGWLSSLSGITSRGALRLYSQANM